MWQLCDHTFVRNEDDKKSVHNVDGVGTTYLGSCSQCGAIKVSVITGIRNLCEECSSHKGVSGECEWCPGSIIETAEVVRELGYYRK